MCSTTPQEKTRWSNSIRMTKDQEISLNVSICTGKINEISHCLCVHRTGLCFLLHPFLVQICVLLCHTLLRASFGIRFVCTIRVKLIKLPCKDFLFLPLPNYSGDLTARSVRPIGLGCICVWVPGSDINWHMVVRINRTETRNWIPWESIPMNNDHSDSFTNKRTHNLNRFDGQDNLLKLRP